MAKITYTKEKLGHFTDLYRLHGGQDVKARYIAYNDILFENINTLANKLKQIIIINELDNGGIIYGSSEYATMALKKLAEALDSKGKYVDTIKSINDGVNKKISFNILSGKSTKSFPKNAKKWNIEL